MEEKKTQYREAANSELLFDLSLQLFDLLAVMQAQLVAQSRILAHLTGEEAPELLAQLQHAGELVKAKAVLKQARQYEVPEQNQPPGA